MARNPKKKGHPIRAAIARLENPYAFVEPEDLPSDSQRTASELRYAYIRILEHPHALLSIDEQASPITLVDRETTPQKIVAGNCSKAEFRARCRTIFGAYMPALEKGKLRTHHREFIVRNESRSAETRHHLLIQLEKYDLSSYPGLSGQFNRERDVFTEEKLRKIERDAENGE